MTILPLLIDYREPNSIRQPLADISEVLELPWGDYGLFVKKDLYLIERKEIGDFLTSLSTGHLMEQLRALRERTPYSILLVEGFFSPDKEGNLRLKTGVRRWNYYGILTLLLEIQMDLGIMLVQTTSDWATVGWLRSFRAWAQKGEHKALARISQPRVPADIWDAAKTERMRFLMCLPGVGQDIARGILEQFSSLYGFLNASSEEIEEVPDIGRKRAEDIREFLGKPELPRLRKRMKAEEKVALLRKYIEEPLEIHPNEAQKVIEHIMGRQVWVHELAKPELLFEELQGRARPESVSLQKLAETLDKSFQEGS